jgi:hypothetical protein
MPCQLNHLLRRTFLGVAALAAVISIPAHAQQVMKTEGGVLCNSYTTISIAPTGGIAVTGCSATAAGAGGAGTFSVAATGTLAMNITSTNTFTITRSNGTTGPVTVTFDRGGGCGPAPLTGDTVNFADAQATANVTVRTPNNDATCTVTLRNATAGSPTAATSAPLVGSPSLAYAFVGAGAGVPPGAGTAAPPPGSGGGGAFNCPAIPADANASFSLTFGGGLNGSLGLKSQQIGYTALPSFSSGSMGGNEAAKVAATIGTNAPSSGTVEVSINHCPGVIDTARQYVQGTNAGSCYKSFPVDQNEHDQFWFEAVGVGGAAATDAMANTYGVCEAYATNGPWYVNVRYTYTVAGPRNMTWQVNPYPLNP